MTQDREPDEDDYPFMILKNRLAKGEITIDEFNKLREALTKTKETEITTIKEDLDSLKEGVSSISHKSLGTAVALATLLGIFGIMGIGHLYVRKRGRGIIILVGGIVIVLIIVGINYETSIAPELVVDFKKLVEVIWAYVTVYFGIYVMQIIDVYRKCKKYNDYIETHNKPPW